MKMDYEVFEPDNERLAQIIVRFLQERGYNAGYQLGYPNNKIFIRVDTKEEANRISAIIRRFIEEFRLTGSEITFDELQKSINIPKSVLTEAENVANLAPKPEFEPEEPEQKESELEPMTELEIEPEEPESEPISEFEPEPEELETEPVFELEPEAEEPEPEQLFELEPEPEEPEKPEPKQKAEAKNKSPSQFFL